MWSRFTVVRALAGVTLKVAFFKIHCYCLVSILNTLVWREIIISLVKQQLLLLVAAIPICELDHYKLLEGLGGLGYKLMSFILKGS